MLTTVLCRHALPLVLIATLASAQQPQQVDPSDLAAYRTYDNLRRSSPGGAERFLALHFAAANKRDYALLARLRSLTIQDDVATRREIGGLLASDYPNLIATGRLELFARLAAFSPDGARVITLEGGALQWWNAATLAPIGPAIPVKGEPLALAVAPDDRRAVMAFPNGGDSSSLVLRTANGDAFGAPLPMTRPITAFALSPDGRTAVTADDRGDLRRFQIDTGAAVGGPVNFADGIAAVTVLDSGTAAVVSDRGTMQSLSFDQGAIGSPAAIPKLAMAVHMKGSARRLVTRDGEVGIRMWNVPTTAAPAPSRSRTCAGAATMNPATSGALTICDQRATLWTGPDSPVPLGSAAGGLFSPDGKTVFTFDGKTGRFWRAADGAPAGAPVETGYEISQAVFSGDSKYVLTAGVGDDRSEARLWRSDNGAAAGVPIRQPAGVTTAIALSRDGRTAIIGSADGIARMWRTDNGTLLGRFRHGEAIDRIVIDADGQTVLTATGEGSTSLWRITGQPIARIPFVGPIVDLKFSPGGKTILLTTMDSARLYRTLDGKSIAAPCEFGDVVYEAAFAPDGQHVLLRTGEWSYLWEPLGKGLLAAIYAPWIAAGPLRFLDASGRRVEGVAVQLRDEMAGFRVLDFDSPGAEPIAGDPAQLLEEWKRKLSLAFEAQGRIVSVRRRQ